MNYSDYYLTSKEKDFESYKKDQSNLSPFYRTPEYYRATQYMRQDKLIHSYLTADSTWASLVNAHFDLEFDPAFLDGPSGKSPKLAVSFYNKHISTTRTLLRRYEGNTKIGIEVASLLIDTCLFGIMNYCSWLYNITSNRTLKEVLQSQDVRHNLALCKKLMPLLYEVAIQSSLKDKVDRIAEVVTRAEGKVELYMAGKNSTHFKKIYQTMYPNMKREGCYIATMVYGSYDASEVIRLRWYRDTVLQKSHIGRAFVKLYYLVSPFIIAYLGRYSLFHKVSKRLIEHMFKSILN